MKVPHTGSARLGLAGGGGVLVRTDYHNYSVM